MRRALAAAGAACLACGVLCQFLQHTDQRQPMSYFTVWSAILAAIVLTIEATRPSTAHEARQVPRACVWATIHGSAVVGCAVSGLVFATVIAPSTPTGTWFQPWDDYWVRAANVLMHGLGPSLAVLAYGLTPLPGWQSRRPWRAAAVWCWWPVTYLSVMGVFTAVGVTSIPYPFLDPSSSPLPLVGGALMAVSVVFLVVGRALTFLNTFIQRSTTKGMREPGRSTHPLRPAA